MSDVVKSNAKFGFVLAVAAAAAMGLYPPCTRAAYADGANAVFIIIGSLFFRAISMASYCHYKRLKLFEPGRGRKEIIWGGFFQAVTMAGLFIAMIHMQGALVIIIFYIFPLLFWLLLVCRGETRFSALTVLWIVIALGGLSLVVDVWNRQATIDWLGVGLSLLAAVATVCRTYIYGRQLETKSPFVVGAENFLVAAVVSLLVLLWKFPVLPTTVGGYAWAGLGFLGSIVGSFGMFYGMMIIGPFKWSLFGKMEPVFVALFSALFLGEYLTTSQYIGMALVLGSLVAYQLTTRPKPVPETGE